MCLWRKNVSTKSRAETPDLLSALNSAARPLPACLASSHGLIAECRLQLMMQGINHNWKWN